MTKATSFTLEQLNQKQEEVHNLQMRLKKCIKERDALKEKAPTRMYRYVVNETIISERYFEAHCDEDAQRHLQQMRDGAIDWDLEQHDAEVVEETLYHCPDSGEGHYEIEIKEVKI